MKAELTNLTLMREEQLKDKDKISKKELKERFSQYRMATKENREKMVCLAKDNPLIEHETLENGLFICKGDGDFKKQFACTLNVDINDSEFHLFEGFIMEIGSHEIRIKYNEKQVFRIDIEKINKFHIGWG